MKIKIGPYIKFFGVFQIASAFVFWNEDLAYRLGRRLAATPLQTFFEWIHSKRTRTVKVTIHDYDVWNMDSTLELIIFPMLLKIRENKHGSPSVSNDDVPPDLHRPDDFDVYETDPHHHARWDYVLSEMIWTFDPETSEDFYFSGEYDREGHKFWLERKQRGYELFGKYFTGLWT